LYGSQQEYKDQVALREKSGYDLYRILGYKSYYTNGPSSFLQQSQNYSMDATQKRGKMVYTLSRKNAEGKTGKMYFNFWVG
jgi:hypothetical protein